MKSDWRDRRVLGRPWQDWVYSVGEVVFLIALVPALFSGSTHIPLYTGLSTGFLLYLFGVCSLSYRNYMTLIIGLVTATVWVLLGLGVVL